MLQDAAGTPLGFILCSRELSEKTGDCVFMAVPGQVALIDSLEADLISQRREAGESTWQVSCLEPLSMVVRTPGLQQEVFVEVSNAGSGQWGVGRGADREFVGLAALPQSD
jgi:hypothetical protein